MSCTVVVLTCFVMCVCVGVSMCGFCNVWVCACVGFVMCACACVCVGFVMCVWVL